MSTLIMEITGNRYLNHLVFPPKLSIYDDLLIYKTRGLIKVNEITISYNHISQVNLKSGLIFASLEMICHGSENVTMKYIGKGAAIRAKKAIDQKMYHAHSGHKLHENKPSENMHNFEKTLNRYKELLQQGKITKREFEKKRQEILKKI